MSVPRAAATSLRSVRTSIYSSVRPSSRLCTDCLRQYRLHQPRLSAPRRNLQTTTYRPQATATAHRVQDLPSEPPPPPRNAGIPETSIAGGRQLDNAQEQASSGKAEEARTPQNDEFSITENEAQKRKPASTASQPPSSTEPSSRPARKSKLRPRKAAMTLTPSAVEQLRALLSQPTPQLIRVGVKNRGCSGLAYHLEYVDKPGMFDEAVEQDGVKVLIDSKALFSIIGSEMDWAEDKLARRFVFRNPNITEQCGCGESFSIS